MIVNIDGVSVYFPYNTMHSEQKEYITHFLKVLHSSGTCLLEMPSGTGKTISILSAVLSYFIHCSKNNLSKPKFMYCSRTVGEIEKALEELKLLIDYIKRYHASFNFLGMGLCSRSFLCVNESAVNSGNVDFACQSLVRSECSNRCEYFVNLEELGFCSSLALQKQNIKNITQKKDNHLNSLKYPKNQDTCTRKFPHSNLKNHESHRNDLSCSENPQILDTKQKNHTGIHLNDSDILNSHQDHIPPKDIRSQILSTLNGIYTLGDLKELGKTYTVCPYYLARYLLNTSDIVIFPYNYVIDPRIRNIVLQKIPQNSVVIFDEAHNIDNACIEALSVEIQRNNLDACKKELTLLEEQVRRAKVECFNVLENERRLLREERMGFVDGHVPYTGSNSENIPYISNQGLSEGSIEYSKIKDTDNRNSGIEDGSEGKNITENCSNTDNKQLSAGILSAPGSLKVNPFDFHIENRNTNIRKIVNNIEISDSINLNNDLKDKIQGSRGKNTDSNIISDFDYKSNSKNKQNTDDYTQRSAEAFFASNYDFAPGSIRSASHFLSTMRRCCEYLRTKLKTAHVTCEPPQSFIKNLSQLAVVDLRSLGYLSTRMGVLIRTLNIAGQIDLSGCRLVADFMSLAASHKSGFSVLYTPFDEQANSVFCPKLRLCCLNGAIGLQAIKSFRVCLVTSGTLSPLPLFAKLLNLTPTLSVCVGATLKRNAVCPLIVTKGNDQMAIQGGSLTNKGDNQNLTDIKNANELLENSYSGNNSDFKTQVSNFAGLRNFSDSVFGDDSQRVSSSYALRNDPSVVRNYGLLVLELSKVVPDGMVVFFPSYLFMQEIITIWSESNLITKIKKQKLILVETKKNEETQKALEIYKQSILRGRGAILFAIARGKVSEGVDFKNEHGRCALLLGVPYQYTESLVLKKRIEFLEEQFNINKSEFLNFDAMRQAAQCLGRVYRNKNDYGLFVMADYRFDKSDRKEKLPMWIRECIEQGNTNLSIDMAVCIAKKFFREMAQPTE